MWAPQVLNQLAPEWSALVEKYQLAPGSR